MLQGGFHDFPSESPRLTHTQATDRIARKRNLDSALGGFFSQCVIHATLHDAEEYLSLTGPRWGRCPHLPSRAQLGSFGVLRRCNLGELALARPDGDVWAYVFRVPG